MPPVRIPPWSATLAWPACLLYMTVSGTFLDAHGWDYSLEGGFPLFKVHPGTYCLLAAWALILAQGNPLLIAGRVAAGTPVQAAFCVTAVGLATYVIGRFGIAGASFMLDAQIAPPLMTMLLCRLPPARVAKIFVAAVACLGLNGLIGVGEFAAGARITPYLVDGKPMAEAFFRPTALLGHPLLNALLMATGVLICPALTRHRALGRAASLAMAASLVPFGGRTAMMLTIVVSTLTAPAGLARALTGPGLSYRGFMTAGALALTLLAGCAGGVAMFGANTRVFAGLAWDSSANSRVQSFEILDTLTPGDELFGIGPAEILRRSDVMGQYNGTIGLENSWLILFLCFGAIGLMFFVGTLLCWIVLHVRDAPAAAFPAAVFLLIASTNNTLASKNCSLMMVAILLQGARAYRADTRARTSQQ